MLVIRLSRTGRKKQPYYRVVVAEKSAPVKGRFIEVLGNYNPRTKDLKIDVDRAKERVASGARPSESAEALLEKAGVLKREAITEKNRRPERKTKKEMKAESDEGSPAAATTAPDEAQSDEKAGDEKPAAKAEAKAGTEPEKGGAKPAKADANTDKKPEKSEKEAKNDQGDSK